MGGTGENLVLAEKLLVLRASVIDQMNSKKDDEAMETIKTIEQLIGKYPLTDVNGQFLIHSILAKYYKRANNYDKAASYSQQALHIATKIDEKHTREWIDLYINYAGLERDYHHYSNGRILLAKLLALLDKKNWKDAYVYGLTYRLLGDIYTQEGNIENGITQLETALRYFQKDVAETDPIIIKTIQLISSAYVQIEDYEQALALQQQLKEVFEQKNDQISLGKTLMKKGEIYFYINLKEARKTIIKALNIFKEVYKNNHLEIAKANLMLGELEENMAKLPRAITYYKRSLQQFEKFYKNNHFMIVYTYSKIGTLSIKLNELKQAKQYLEKGLSLSHQYTKIRLQFLNALGKIYSSLKQYDEALASFQEFLEILKQGGKMKSKAYADILQAIAFNFIQQDQLEDAHSYYEDALAIYQQLTTHLPGEKGLTYIRLAYCQENIKDKDLLKAEKYYEKGFQLIEKVGDDGLMEEALAGMISFFERNPNPKKKRKYEHIFVKLQTTAK